MASPSWLSLAANAASTVWASVVASWFLSGRARCAQVARASGFLELLQLSDQLVSQVFGSVRRQARWLGLFRTKSPFGRLRRPAGFELDCGLV